MIMRTQKNDENQVRTTLESLEPINNVPFEQPDEVFPRMEAIEEQEETAAFEIVPGMTVEEMKSMFFDKESLIEPDYQLWQITGKEHRYYYEFDQSGNPIFYPSVTTILGETLRQSPILTKWVADKGWDNAEAYKMERAAYGTFMHGQFEELIISRVYDLDGMAAKLKTYIDKQNLPDSFFSYLDDLKKDILAFAQFVLDYHVKPLAVEVALRHPAYGYAGMIDLVCEMDVKPGSKERIRAIVDFKSGRKNFYEEHEVQLGMYREMWNVNFPEHQIIRLFNFSPKDWRKKPSYNLKDQTNSRNIEKIPHLLNLAEIDEENVENVFTTCAGVISLDDERGISLNVLSLSLAEIIKKRQPKEKKPEKGTITPKEDEKPSKAAKKAKSTTKSVKATTTKAKPKATKAKVTKKTSSVSTKKAEKVTKKPAISTKKAEKLPKKAEKLPKSAEKLPKSAEMGTSKNDLLNNSDF